MASDSDDELRRKFLAALGVSGTNPGRTIGDLPGPFGVFGPPEPRLELRRPPLGDLVILRIRVDLDESNPPVWRRLDLRSDLTLDVVHEVLQAAFGWTDSHLHRFSLGGGPFDRASQCFLCPYDVAEGDIDDDGDVAAADVRLDECLQEAGDELRYVYDYGDSWELTLRLEAVVAAGEEAPTAVLVDGARPAPPEDSRGRFGDGLELEDSVPFNIEALNADLRSPEFLLREAGVDPRLVALVRRLSYDPIGPDLTARALSLLAKPTPMTDDELREALRAYIWFLDRAKDGGIELTQAGYLKPVDVVAASAVVPSMALWLGLNNREINAVPLLDFRLSMQRIGLLRKYHGKLLLTRAGAAAQRDTRVLWDHLASKLTAPKADYELVAALVLLVYTASSVGEELPNDAVMDTIAELGWRRGDGGRLEFYDLYGFEVLEVLNNVGPAQKHGVDHIVSPAEAALARAALMRGK